MSSQGPTAKPSHHTNHDDGDAYEEVNVHAVYNQIAPHFSQTRYKPWPLITQFLSSLPSGSVGLDVGCGNGKYFNLNPDIFVLGSDRSSGLAGIARDERTKGSTAGDVILGDILSLPHQAGKFDFAISIAVVHHLSTSERRLQAIRSILETLVQGGSALIYVWALEQENSRRGWSEGDSQDVMVPWVMRQKKDAGSGCNNVVEETTFNRYYHLYRKGELEEDVLAAGGAVRESGYDRDNWWAIVEPRR